MNTDNKCNKNKPNAVSWFTLGLCIANLIYSIAILIVKLKQ